MWWQLFFVLVATAAASEDDSQRNRRSCLSWMYRQCGPEDGIYPEFPDNEEDLEGYCNFTVKYYECMNSLARSCALEVTGDGRYLVHAEATVRRICYGDAAFRTAVVEHYPCFKANLTKIQACDGFSRDMIDSDSFSAAMNEIGVTNVEGVPDVVVAPSNCLDMVYEVGCTAATAGELCGNAAGVVFVSLWQGYDTLFQVCPPGTKEKLPEIVRVIQMEAEKLKSVENTLKKKK